MTPPESSVSDTTISNVTLEPLIMLIKVSFTLPEGPFMMFIVKMSLMTITYYRNVFIVQAIAKVKRFIA
jgi:hypothetical protein